MSATTVDTALQRLVTLWAGVAPDGLDVIDGQPSIDPPIGWLAVGFDRSDEPAVTGGFGTIDMGQRALEVETYDISCLLSMWRGNSETAALRTLILSTFDVFRAALRGDRTLGGSVARSRLAEYEFEQSDSTLGDAATVRFTVHVEAFA